MNPDTEKYIYQAVTNLINHSVSPKKLEALQRKHTSKIHFIPKRYRIFGGILQSMNIQFGNFIEELMSLIIADDGNYEIITSYSGKKNNKFKLSFSNENRIDEYITKCQTVDGWDIAKEFNKLQNDIILDSDTKYHTFKHDIDVLFRNKKTNIIYYLEIKYNDDHDTGKFIDINRKFIKTYAYLVNEFNIKNTEELVPILFYFTNKKMKGNIYLPEKTNIRRGSKFFDEFLKVKYEDINNCLETLSENTEIVKRFDDLYNKVVKGC